MDYNNTLVKLGLLADKASGEGIKHTTTPINDIRQVDGLDVEVVKGVAFVQVRGSQGAHALVLFEAAGCSEDAVVADVVVVCLAGVSCFCG